MEIYVLGPGVGECIVVIMPDRRVVVVDSCERGGRNLSAALLDHLAIRAVDLLVVTHPDLDHIKGIAELVQRYAPTRVWRYPFGLLRDVLQVLGGLETQTGNQRYADALAANDELDELLRASGRVERVHPGQEWSPPGAGYRVRALAPTQYDIARASAKISGLVERRRGEPRLSAAAAAMFAGKRPLGDLPNMVSLGLVIEWGARKVLLAGDVENGDGSDHSGWKGVLATLDAPDVSLGHLVDDVDFVKVAHHGSIGALSEPAWSRHAGAGKTVAVIAPYSPTPLPDDQGLRTLRRSVKRLGISADEGAVVDRALAAGWVTADGGAAATLPLGAALKIGLLADGTMAFERGAEASWLE